jgi:hypothetical protein
VVRSLILFVAIVLLALPAFWLFGTTIPVASFRTGGYGDFVFFAEALTLVYGGVALGVAIYWALATVSGLPVRSLGILSAGVSGAAALGLIVVVVSGLYGVLVLGSFERGVGNLWGLIVIFATLLGAFVAAGLALLWFASASHTPSGGRSAGPQGLPTVLPRIPSE